jgi:hypothetical protein
MACIDEGRYEGHASCFFYETKGTIVMKFANFVGTSPLRSWGYISIRSPSLSTHFFHLCVSCHNRFRAVCPGIREVKTTNSNVSAKLDESSPPV